MRNYNDFVSKWNIIEGRRKIVRLMGGSSILVTGYNGSYGGVYLYMNKYLIGWVEFKLIRDIEKVDAE